MEKIKPSFLGIVPFLVFIALYLGAGIFFHTKGVSMAFYQVPAPIAMFAAICVAFIFFSGSIKEKFNQFIEGCGQHDIIIMCMIYILAGAFATVTKTIGGVEAAANFGLSIVPAQYITAGIFAIACFISISIGTSVGTIVALGPIAVQLATQASISLPLLLAALLGGAMFGDNLSFISDTTIASTRSQNCEMKDKFKVNIFIALPAAIFTLILLLIFGRPDVVIQPTEYSVNFIKILPYIFILVASALGGNVFLVLILGTVFAGIIGMVSGNLNFIGWINEVYTGFSGMTEIFLLSLLTGGLARMSFVQGGIAWMLESIRKLIRGKKTAELGIGLLSSVTDMATANNTVAIIIAGPVAKEISTQYNLSPKRVASILDTFSSIFQGILPYGAQMLILISFTQSTVDPLSILPFMWYSFALLIMSCVSIIWTNNHT
ncbi:MAG: Na+/H+ antiporter NhaC family protein [Spirochaetia bacterium]